MVQFRLNRCICGETFTASSPQAARELRITHYGEEHPPLQLPIEETD